MVSSFCHKNVKALFVSYIKNIGSAVCWGSKTRVSWSSSTRSTLGMSGVSSTSTRHSRCTRRRPGVVRGLGPLYGGLERALLNASNFHKKRRTSARGKEELALEISHLLILKWFVTPVNNVQHPHQGRWHGLRWRRQMVHHKRVLWGQQAQGCHQQREEHEEGRLHGGWHQPRWRQEVLKLPRHWPPPTSVSFEGGRHFELRQPDVGESLRLLVKCQHRGVQQQRGQEQEAAEMMACHRNKIFTYSWLHFPLRRRL